MSDKPIIEPKLSSADQREMENAFPKPKAEPTRRGVLLKRLVVGLIVLAGFALDLQASVSPDRVFGGGSLLAAILSNPGQVAQVTFALFGSIPGLFVQPFPFLPGAGALVTLFLRFIVPASLAVAVCIRTIPSVARIVYPQDEIKLESMIDSGFKLSWPKPVSSETLRREHQKG